MTTNPLILRTKDGDPPRLVDPYAHREHPLVIVHLAEGDWQMTVGEFIDMAEDYRKRVKP